MKRGYQGQRFILYDRENECHINLTTDEVQVAFLRLERFSDDPDLPDLQRCDGAGADNGRCRFCMRGMQRRDTGD